ncbi:hypothetical protein PG994_007470 [Apiospora phragmitis]|uniref:Uncharacterized protein n=1 Tax=Apiospora phragmitis TaxID=2905665 RepID=A0ABR1V0W1_9PEZI
MRRVFTIAPQWVILFGKQTLEHPAYFWRTDDAYTEAHRAGKVPALCAPNSTFLGDYQSCVSCSEESSHANTTATMYLKPEFAEFVEYCDIKDVFVTLTMSATVANREFPVTMTTNINIPANFTVGVITQTAGLSDVPTTATPVPEGGGGNQSRAWIAAPVIGSLVILMTVMLLLRRRKKLHDWGNDDMDKPQLHSDCITRPLPYELENTEKRTHVELPETPYFVNTAGGRHELPDPGYPIELASWHNTGLTR